MTRIASTAVVERGAQLADDVSVGAYAVIGPRVSVGASSSVGAHVVLAGNTTIGRGNQIHAHAVLGGPPQDKKYAGEDTRLVLGDHNTIREFCTFNTGTVQDQGVTRIGSHNWIMAYAHIAHDCIVGDNTILANNATLAGHVHVGDWVILGGMTAVHQFVHVGAHAMTGGGTILLQDLPPFVICNGNPAQAHGLNVEGLKRRGFPAESIAALRRAYKTLYREGLTVAAAAEVIRAQAEAALEQRTLVLELLDFVQSSQRGIVR